MGFKFLDHAEEIPKAWYDDGVVTFSIGTDRSDGRPNKVKRTLKKLQRKTGIRFQEVDEGGEINVNFTDEIIGLSGKPISGLATWDRLDCGGLHSNIFVDEDFYTWRTTMVHELGHAMGLAHNHEVTNSIMSYNRDYFSKESKFFYDLDIAAIEDLWGQFLN